MPSKNLSKLALSLICSSLFACSQRVESTPNQDESETEAESEDLAAGCRVVAQHPQRVVERASDRLKSYRRELGIPDLGPFNAEQDRAWSEVYRPRERSIDRYEESMSVWGLVERFRRDVPDVRTNVWMNEEQYQELERIVLATAAELEDSPLFAPVAAEMRASLNVVQSNNLWGKKITTSRFRCATYPAQESLLQEEEGILQTTEFSEAPRRASELRIWNRAMEIGEDATRVWWDTILEGPYSLNGDLGIAWITVRKQGRTTLGYVVRYEQPAVFTEDDECTPNELPNGETEWENCEEGVVAETFLFDAQWNEIEQSESYAEFE